MMAEVGHQREMEAKSKSKKEMGSRNIDIRNINDLKYKTYKINIPTNFSKYLLRNTIFPLTNQSI